MTTVISDLVARVRAEGVEQATQQVKAVGDAAAQTTRALEIMAQQMSKAAPTQGTPEEIFGFLQAKNVQPTAAAMAQAAQEMQKIAAAAQQAAQPAQQVARAATEHAAAAQSGAQAAQSVADGWKLSESSMVRFGAALVGVNLGISLIAGAASLVHDAIVDTVQAQVDWERSLVQVRALYGDIAPRVVALSQAQAALPGVTASQQQLLQANIAAGFLTTRYGLSPSVTGTLTTQAARLGGLLFPGDAAAQASLQGAFLQYAQSGGSALVGPLGLAGDPASIANRLGFRSEAALQALTPQQLVEARAQIANAAAAQANIQGGADSRGLLDTQRDLQHQLEQAQADLQTGLENLRAPQPPAIAGQSELARASNFPLLGPAAERQQAQDLARAAQGQQDYVDQMQAYQRAVGDAQRALAENSAALTDNQKQLDAANAALARFGVETGSAAARLLSFTGSLEDTFSIARGDVGAQAQAGVAARARSAIPSIGTPLSEITYQATQSAYQDAYQNFVAQQAQGQQDNAIRDFLTQAATQQGPGLENQRTAAQRALDQAQQTQPIQVQLGQARLSQAQQELAASETQAELDRISIEQRQRYVQLMRDTLDLRLLDNAQQQRGIEATMMLVRAQQSALPAQYRASDAQYQQRLAQALSQQRMARLLQGQDVSDLPTLDQLVNMNYSGQLAEAENAPGLLQGERQVELQGRGVQEIGLQQSLTESNLHLAELADDARNLADVPAQTALQQSLLANNLDQLGIQTEMRELLKALVYYMTQQPPSAAGGVADQADRAARQVVQVLTAPASPPAQLDLPGARRGPY